MAVFLTGDVHGSIDRFTDWYFPEQDNFEDEENYLIVLGDFGLIFSEEESRIEKRNLDYLASKNYTTLFIDGNHENFDRLYKYPIVDWNGWRVHKIKNNIYHLIRGEVYEIMGKKFFAFGGAASHDIRDGILEKDDERLKTWRYDRQKMFRINHVSWWKEEMPSEEEMENGRRNLEKHDWKVDYILTHDCQSSLLPVLDGHSGRYVSDKLNKYLQEISNKTEYKQWFFGHHHVDKYFDTYKATGMYFKTMRIV